jgi:hypothetical protein
VTLLWLQGALLNRQRVELASLRSEITELAAAINDTLFTEDDPYMTPVSAARLSSECGAKGGGSAVERMRRRIPGLTALAASEYSNSRREWRGVPKLRGERREPLKTGDGAESAAENPE